MSLDGDKNWYVDRKIPLIPMLALVIQTLAVVWWVSFYVASTDARLLALEKSEGISFPNATRITILETKFDEIQKTLGRIESNQNRNLRQILKEVAPGDVEGKLEIKP